MQTRQHHDVMSSPHHRPQSRANRPRTPPQRRPSRAHRPRAGSGGMMPSRGIGRAALDRHFRETFVRVRRHRQQALDLHHVVAVVRLVLCQTCDVPIAVGALVVQASAKTPEL